MSSHKKPSIKLITVKNLLVYLLVIISVMVIIAGLTFRSLSREIIINKSLALSETIKAGLTSHMKAGIMDKRDYYLNEIKTIENVKKINITRAPSVIKQYGPGQSSESFQDSIIQKVFQSKQPSFTLDEFSENPTLRAVIPYIAKKEGTLSCLDCHHVSDGTVLGTVDIEMDISDYQDLSLKIIIGIVSLLSLFTTIIVFNTNKTIQKFVKDPLESIISHAKRAYNKNIPVNPRKFETKEFEKVAQEINLFNSEILTNQKLLRDKNRQLNELNLEIENTLKETIFTMGVIEEERSQDSRQHTKRVTLHCKLLAEKIGLTQEEVYLIETASPLHDIGKIGIPDNILHKPGKLTDNEFTIMKNHTAIGYSMLKHSTRDVLKAAAIIAHQHHEKWDGSGYPQGLIGEEIHVFGRIASLVDVFDALISKRIYKDPWPVEKIISYLQEQREKTFDPHILDIFLKHIDEFVQINNKHQ